MRYALEDDAEERVAIEKEIVRFEAWVEKVRPDLTNPDYEASYEELRTAIRILGIKCVDYPTLGDWPFRHQIVATVPEILAKSTDLRSSLGSPVDHQRRQPSLSYFTTMYATGSMNEDTMQEPYVKQAYKRASPSG